MNVYFWKYPRARFRDFSPGPRFPGKSGGAPGGPGEFPGGISGNFREIRDFGPPRAPPGNPGFRAPGTPRGPRAPPGPPGRPSWEGRTLTRRRPKMAILGGLGPPRGPPRDPPRSGPRTCNPCPDFGGFSGCRGPFNKCIFRSGFGVFFCVRGGVARVCARVCGTGVGPGAGSGVGIQIWC